MAAYSQGGTLAELRADRKIIREDLYYRYEITATNTDVVMGEVWLRKDEVDAADAVPDTIAIS